MTIKKIVGKLHLWLGLASGLLVVFLGITGCILAFEHEIRAVTQSYLYVTPEDKPLLPPTQLKAIAEKHLEGKEAKGVDYPPKGKSAVVAYWDEENYKLIYVNPYSGEVLKVKNMNRDFFRFIINGHYYLWLPPNIGQPVLASATLIFLFMLISGIVLWWPRNKAARKQRFSIKWGAKWKRVNYDLHNVLGFYATWIALFLAITGLVMGFQWFAKSVYWVSSGGETMVEHTHPHSDTTLMGNNANIADQVWNHHLPDVKSHESIGVYFPADHHDPVEVGINHRPGTYYNSDYYHYDQYSGVELPAVGSYAGTFQEASVADKIVRMNYDIHVGAVLGLPGKILAFCGSLIASSLPITGFLIWRGRRRNGIKVKKRERKEEGVLSVEG